MTQASASVSFTGKPFDLLDPSVPIEEETVPSYTPCEWYPVTIGAIFNSRYRVLGKLGWGRHSTTWFSKDLQSEDYVALKVYNMYKRRPDQSLADGDDAVSKELRAYEKMISMETQTTHRGKHYLRPLVDQFIVSNAGNTHHCLILRPMWGDVVRLEKKQPYFMLSNINLRSSIAYTLKALDYMHSKCQLIHTDIKASNVMFTIGDLSMLKHFEDAELSNPCPRKLLRDRTIYQSREFRLQQFGCPFLCDFGETRSGDVEHDEFIWRGEYCPPEVMLQTKWDYKVDIWMVGILAWRLYEGTHLFEGRAPDTKQWDPGYHLAEIVAVLGIPSAECLRRGKSYDTYFDKDGYWKYGIPIRDDIGVYSGNPYNRVNKRGFLNFLSSMLKWDPNERKTAKELLEDPWLFAKEFPGV